MSLSLALQRFRPACRVRTRAGDGSSVCMRVRPALSCYRVHTAERIGSDWARWPAIARNRWHLRNVRGPRWVSTTTRRKHSASIWGVYTDYICSSMHRYEEFIKIIIGYVLRYEGFIKIMFFGIKNGRTRGHSLALLKRHSRLDVRKYVLREDSKILEHIITKKMH